MHACCAPCAMGPVDVLRQEGHEITAHFYNPNIHPNREYKKRRDAMEEFARQVSLPVLWQDDDDLEAFLRLVLEDLPGRCRRCYRMRLTATARRARDEGFGAFTSTLLVSPYQAHGVLREEAEAAAQAWGVDFVYRDFRPLYREFSQKSRDMGLYRQGYCGCVFSEAERYARGRK